MRSLTITYITASLLFLYGLISQKAFALPATPEPEIVQFPYLLIMEVGFKNSDQDMILLQVIDDMNDGGGANINGLALKDDSVFFTLKNDLELKSGDEILIYFKNESEEIYKADYGLQINLTKNGLTGTTEQAILLNRNKEVIDAVCWTSSTPTATEIKELNDLFNKGGWISNDINSCINSESVGKDRIIRRKNLNDTNSKEDWEIKIIEEEEEEDDDEDEDDDNNLAIKKENSDLKTNLKICNEGIIISEFLPNPAGTDSGKEWIEIMNSSGADCSLYGWALDDEEGGSKVYKINSSEIIPSGGFMLLPSWQTKLNLNNDEDSVRLFNQNNELVDEVKYKKALENKSYALNIETNEFSWTSKITPLMHNMFDEEEEEEKEEKASKIQNGTLSEQIYITEILPNPKGQDKGMEWIEILNDSDEAVKMGNWKIETGSKTFTFENITMQSQEYLVLYDYDLGFAIKNSNETFTLKDFNDNEISSIQYDKVFEGKSLMEITNVEGDLITKSWIWTDEPTPGEANHSTYTHTGMVEEFDNTVGKLKIAVNKDESDEKILDILVLASGKDVMDSAFRQGALVRVVLKPNEDKWILEEYEVLKEPSEKEKAKESNGLLYIIISSLPPIGFLGYSAVKKYGLIKIV